MGETQLATKNGKQKGKQVSLAATAGVSKKKRKKKAPLGTVIIRVMVAILVTLSLAFIGVVAFGIISSFSSDANAHDVDLTTYDTTPQSEVSKVSYFLVGVKGETEDSAMDMLTLICYDKKAKTAQFLQVPTDTYVGNSGKWAVSRVGNIWNNPAPLAWCETCRKRVYEPEQGGGKHTTCGTPLTEKTGSAVENLTDVFNDQYSMPVDNYFILSRETLISLVDAVGGIDVELESAMQVGTVKYAAGKRVLDGSAALQYAHIQNYNGTPAKDLERLVRQRKVWTALLQRMSAMDEKKLYEDVISPVMAGPEPIRTNTDAESVAAMVAGIHSGSTDSMSFAQALAKLIHSFKKVDTAQSAFYILPGQVAKQGTATYFSVNRAALVTLLQDHFNPYGLPLKDEHLQVTELPTANGKVDTKQQAMQGIAVEQSAPTAPTTTAATTVAS